MAGKPLENLTALARKQGGRWRVETQEGQELETLPAEPGATLRWTVAPDRWA